VRRISARQVLQSGVVNSREIDSVSACHINWVGVLISCRLRWIGSIAGGYRNESGGVGEYYDILSSGVIFVFTDSRVKQSHGRSDQYFRVFVNTLGHPI